MCYSHCLKHTLPESVAHCFSRPPSWPTCARVSGGLAALLQAHDGDAQRLLRGPELVLHGRDLLQHLGALFLRRTERFARIQWGNPT